MNQSATPQISESEEELIQRAQTAVSQCNWVVGECASKWTQKYARGRTDADFGAVVGMTADQVFQRRRVWETFGDVAEAYPRLKWSHFYVAINWEDAAECLQWADENEATIAEMKAWRRLQRGEDLTEPAEPDFDETLVSYVPDEPTEVRDPAEWEGDGSRTGGAAAGSRNGDPNRATVNAVARASDDSGDDYAPFRTGAGNPGPAEQPDDAAVATQVHQETAEQLIKRMTTALERCNKTLTPDLMREFRDLPEKTRNRFIRAVGEFSSKVASIR